MDTLYAGNIAHKLLHIEDDCHQALITTETKAVPEWPARSIAVESAKNLRNKPGLAASEGQARLLHDLAGIELQAMELGLRTLREYPLAPQAFREQLAQVTLDESRHLKLCLEALTSLGFEWGHWPTHLGLWAAVAREDTLLDRILIVHRYLEGSGLDASDKIMSRLSGVSAAITRQAVGVIAEEEVGHVRFGSTWYKTLCTKDPDHDFAERLNKLCWRIPRRMEKINWPLRRKAGFSNNELYELENLRNKWLE